jgi:hypothetical protein
MDVGPRPMGLLASLALARFAVTKPLGRTLSVIGGKSAVSTLREFLAV